VVLCSAAGKVNEQSAELVRHLDAARRAATHLANPAA